MSRATVNKVILLGFAGRDGELSHTKAGIALGVLSIATNRSARTATGDYAETTDWHRIKAFGPLGERLAAVKKGAAVFIEAELQYSRWTKDGVIHYGVDIVARSVAPLAEYEGHLPPVPCEEEPPVPEDEPS